MRPVSNWWQRYMCVNNLPKVVTWHAPDRTRTCNVRVGPGVYFMSPGLLDFDVLWHHRQSDEPAAVCSECGCTFGVGGSTLWPHNAGATGAALASGSVSSGLQDGHFGLLVTVRHGSILLGSWLSAGLRQRSSSAVSANSRACVVRRTCISYGDRCFAAACLRLWSSLPAH